MNIRICFYVITFLLTFGYPTVPVTCQTFSEEARLSNDAINTGYGGGDVAIEGGRAFTISSSGVHVYEHVGSQWVQRSVLVSSDGPAFASKLSVSGGVLVAGAPNADNLKGAVYIFKEVSGTWTQVQKLSPPDGAASDFFGIHVAISGSTIIVGAPNHDIAPPQTDQGSVYVYMLEGSTWTQTSKIQPPDHQQGSNFGNRVAIDGDTLAIAKRAGSVPNTGVYVYTRNGAAWTLQQKIAFCEPSGGLGGTQCAFGRAIELSGERLAIGNPFLNVNAQNSHGGVYIYERVGGVWSQDSRIVQPNGQVNDNFGNDLDLDGGRLVVAAPATNVRPGSVYIYTVAQTEWSLLQHIFKTTSGIPDDFGGAIAAAADRIIISRSRDNQSNTNTIGAAYIYTAAAQPVTVSGRVTTPSGQGLRNAVVTMTAADGAVRRATTSSFGIYSFTDVPPGQSYILSVSSRRYRFAPRQVQVASSSISNLDLVGME